MDLEERKRYCRIQAAEKTEGFTSITGAKMRLRPQPLWIPITPLICQLLENAIIVDVEAKGGLLLGRVCVCVKAWDEVCCEGVNDGTKYLQMDFETAIHPR